MTDKCKFCGKEITTNHYYITKKGAVCLNCRERTKSIMRMFGIKKGNDDEILNSDNNHAANDKGADGILGKEVG